MSEPSPTLDPNVGRIIADKYRIDSIVGSGGAGTVYRAVQVGLERPVALKVLNRDLVSNPTAQARFRREARAASRLDHRNSVRVFDYGIEPDGTSYLAMELIEGKDLYKFIYEDWPHSTECIVHIMEQVLSVLAAAHELGIVHRDLKPENIMLVKRTDESGHKADTVKVTDFGIAKTFSEMGEESMKLTQAGTVHGTPEYMAPEQARGEEIDARVDIYSCGVILYEMMTGTLPFVSENAFEVLLMQLSKPVEPPTKRRGSADPRLEPVVMKALAKERNDRYSSAREMREALLDALKQPALLTGDPTLQDRPTLDPRAFAPTAKPAEAMKPTAPVPRRSVAGPADVTAPALAVKFDAPTHGVSADAKGAVNKGGRVSVLRVPTEVIAHAPDPERDEPIDPSIIGVRRKPYALIAVFLVALAAGVTLVARFVLQSAHESTPVFVPPADASDEQTSAAPLVDASSTPDVRGVDARASTTSRTSPPRSTPPRANTARPTAPRRPTR